jgi:hypothetical protein
MKKLPLLTLSLISALLASAQQAFLAPVVIASAGNTSISANGTKLSFTLGETAIASLATADVSLGQGFHNGSLVTTKVDETALADWGVQVFPNPTSQTVFVEFATPKTGGTLQASLWDLQGRQLMAATSMLVFLKNPIDVHHLPPGAYLLRLADGAGSTTAVRIVKTE